MLYGYIWRFLSGELELDTEALSEISFETMKHLLKCMEYR